MCAISSLTSSRSLSHLLMSSCFTFTSRSAETCTVMVKVIVWSDSLWNWLSNAHLTKSIGQRAPEIWQSAQKLSVN